MSTVLRLGSSGHCNRKKKLTFRLGHVFVPDPVLIIPTLHSDALFMIQGNDVLDAVSKGCSVSCFGHKLAVSDFSATSGLLSFRSLEKNVAGVVIFSYNSCVHFIEKKAGMSDLSIHRMSRVTQSFPVSPGSELQNISWSLAGECPMHLCTTSEMWAEMVHS